MWNEIKFAINERWELFDPSVRAAFAFLAGVVVGGWLF